MRGHVISAGLNTYRNDKTFWRHDRYNFPKLHTHTHARTHSVNRCRRAVWNRREHRVLVWQQNWTDWDAVRVVFVRNARHRDPLFSLESCTPDVNKRRRRNRRVRCFLRAGSMAPRDDIRRARRPIGPEWSWAIRVLAVCVYRSRTSKVRYVIRVFVCNVIDKCVDGIRNVPSSPRRCVTKVRTKWKSEKTDFVWRIFQRNGHTKQCSFFRTRLIAVEFVRLAFKH